MEGSEWKYQCSGYFPSYEELEYSFVENSQHEQRLQNFFIRYLNLKINF